MYDELSLNLRRALACEVWGFWRFWRFGRWEHPVERRSLANIARKTGWLASGILAEKWVDPF